MSPIFSGLLQNTLVVTVLCPVAWLVCRGLKSRPAVQHLVWLLLLVKLVLPPVVVWPWVVDIGGWRSPAPPAMALVPTSSLNGDAAGDLAELALLDSQLAALASEEAAIGQSTLWLPTKQQWLNWTPIAIWLIGTLVVLVSLTRQIARQRIIRHDATGAATWLVDLVQHVAQRMRMRPIRTVVSARIASPMICCLGAPRLLWPNSRDDAASSLASEGVVAHELAHVARRDHYVAWFEMAVSVVLWWHPLAWWLRRRLRESRELACDALAVSVVPDRQAYANLLLQLSSASNDQWVAASALGVGDASRKSLERRLIMIFNERASGRVSLSGMVVLGLLAVLCVPGWSLSDDPQVKEAVVPVAPVATAAPPVEPKAASEAVLRGVRFLTSDSIVIPDGGQVKLGRLAQKVDDHDTWLSQDMELGNTGYVAFAGPWGKNQPLEYTVAVGKKNPDGSLSTTFATKLSLDGMPEGFAQRPIGEVVKFDAAAQLQVTFDLGGQDIRFQLPSPVAPNRASQVEVQVDINSPKNVTAMKEAAILKNELLLKQKRYRELEQELQSINGTLKLTDKEQTQLHGQRAITMPGGGGVVMDQDGDGKVDVLVAGVDPTAALAALGDMPQIGQTEKVMPGENGDVIRIIKFNDFNTITVDPIADLEKVIWFSGGRLKGDANVEKAEADFSAKRQELERAERLLKNGTGTAAQVEQVKAALAAAEAQYVVAVRACLEALKAPANATADQPDLQRELLATDFEEAEVNLVEKKIELQQAVELAKTGAGSETKLPLLELAIKKAEIELRRCQLHLKLHDRTHPPQGPTRP